jgi:hypothetical protein
MSPRAGNSCDIASCLAGTRFAGRQDEVARPMPLTGNISFCAALQFQSSIKTIEVSNSKKESSSGGRLIGSRHKKTRHPGRAGGKIVIARRRIGVSACLSAALTPSCGSRRSPRPFEARIRRRAPFSGSSAFADQTEFAPQSVDSKRSLENRTRPHFLQLLRFQKNWEDQLLHSLRHLSVTARPGMFRVQR